MMQADSTLQFQLFPDLASSEYEALKADIAKRGVLVPVERDERGDILDGHHRVRACTELGIVDYPVVIRAGMTDDQKIEHVLTLNLARRHLTPAQRTELEADLRRRGWSFRRIAEKVGVSEFTVHRDVSTVRDITVERSIGRDGRSRPATMPRSALVPTPPASVFAFSEREAARAQAVIERAPPTAVVGVQDVRTLERTVKEQRREDQRESNRALVADAPPATVTTEGQRFATIVLDPPWDWGDEGDADQFGRARPTYATMPIEDIADLPVADLSLPNAHIYVWITNRSLPKGFALLERWGFRYVTMLTWVKPHFGMGNYFRGSTEHVLFGVKGSLPLLRSDAGTHFSASRPAGHSSKPVEFAELVESCSPGPWLEMFARSERPGWVAWGAEVMA